MTLNQGQLIALDRIHSIVEAGGALLIDSPAGVGKTYLAMQAVRDLAEDRMSRGEGFRILIAAPTHSAKRTLQGKLPAEVLGWVTQAQLAGIDAQIFFTTTASAFSMRLDTSLETGESYLVQASNPRLFGGWDLVIIDEVSLLNRKACALLQMGILTKAIKAALLMGDRDQLPPVKEKKSEVFSYDFIEKIELTEQMRCQGPIELVVAKAKGQCYLVTDEDADGDYIRLSATSHDLVDSACEAFAQAHRDGVDYSQWSYLTYSNQDVQYVARKVRKAIWGRAEDYIVGEWLRVKGGVAIAYNSDLVEVTSVEQIRVMGYDSWEIGIYNHLNEQTELVKVLASHEEPRFKQRVDELQAEGDRCKAAGHMTEARQCWTERMGLQSLFATLQYSVAMSVHWSQGCTFERAFVDSSRLSKASNKAQLLYVAYSRAARYLHTVKVVQPLTRQQLIELLAANGMTPEQARDKASQIKGTKIVRPKSYNSMMLSAQTLGLA